MHSLKQTGASTLTVTPLKTVHSNTSNTQTQRQSPADGVIYRQSSIGTGTGTSVRVSSLQAAQRLVILYPA